MLKDPDSEVRAAASLALERIEGQLNLEQLLDQLRKGAIVEKVRAINALGTIGGEIILKPLAYCASRPEADLRGAAVDALGATGNRNVIPVLLERLQDSDSGIRARAIKALGSFPEKSLIPALLPFLAANDGLTDLEAAEVLGKIGAPETEEGLTRLATSTLPAARAAAAKALGMLNPA